MMSLKDTSKKTSTGQNRNLDAMFENTEIGYRCEELVQQDRLWSSRDPVGTMTQPPQPSRMCGVIHHLEHDIS